MSNPSCRPPLCSFNCCDKNGSCPSSKDLCEGSSLRNPIWIYVIIGIVIIVILALAIVLLVIFRRRRLRMEQQEKLAEESGRDVHPVEIEMQREQPQVVVIKPPKKNIYVYDREVQSDASKNNRSGTNSSKISKKSSISQRNLQNPFQKKNSLRSIRGNLL